MRLTVFGVCVTCAIAAHLFDPGIASARRGVVLFGSGEEISHLADIDAAHLPALQEETGVQDLAVGYHHEYFSLFFLNVLTFEGDVVLYSETQDSYWDLEDEDVLTFTGETPEDLGTPFLYKFPGGCFVFSILLIGFGLFKYATRTTSW